MTGGIDVLVFLFCQHADMSPLSLHNNYTNVYRNTKGELLSRPVHNMELHYRLGLSRTAVVRKHNVSMATTSNLWCRVALMTNVRVKFE